MLATTIYSWTMAYAMCMLRVHEPWKRYTWAVIGLVDSCVGAAMDKTRLVQARRYSLLPQQLFIHYGEPCFLLLASSYLHSRDVCMSRKSCPYDLGDGALASKVKFSGCTPAAVHRYFLRSMAWFATNSCMLRFLLKRPCRGLPDGMSCLLKHLLAFQGPGAEV